MRPVSLAVPIALLGLNSLAILTVSPANAQTAALEYTSSGTGSHGSEAVIGYSFIVNSPVTVTDLGANLDPGDFTKATSSEVGLWDSGGTLLLDTTVLNTDTKTGHFRYHAVADTLLTPGSYTVAGLLPASAGFDIGAIGLTTPPEITYGDGRLRDTTTLQEPTANDPFFAMFSPGNFGGTFRFTTPAATPEPGSIALLASFGLTGAGFLARRRKQAHKAI